MWVVETQDCGRNELRKKRKQQRKKSTRKKIGAAEQVILLQSDALFERASLQW